MFKTPKELLARFSDTDLGKLGGNLLTEPRLPGRDESAAVAMECRKTAALCFVHLRTDSEIVTALFVRTWTRLEESLEAADPDAAAGDG